MFNDTQVRTLKQPLPTTAISTRKQGGASLSYLEGQYVIDVLNRIFGFGAWDHEIVEVKELYEEAVKTKGGKDAWEVAYRATVRLRIRGEGGQVCVHEDVGGDTTKLPSRGEAHENSIKGAVTDALKRAARCMGEQFGLSLYGDLSQVEHTPSKEERIQTAIAWAVQKGAYATQAEAEEAWGRLREDTLTDLRRRSVAPTWEAIKDAWVREVTALVTANREALEQEREVA